MNVMQLNTDIYNSLGVLSNDESYLEKAARYLKKLAQTKRDVENAKAKEEALASINQAFTELKLHREGKMDFIPAEDLLNEL
jgi:predicted ribosome quality control (RQC) complex YloA/Tae2 family protein